MDPDAAVETKAATGAASTLDTSIYPDWVSVLLPSEFVAVSVTVKVPEVAYVWTGFCSVEVPPSPKSHAHEVGDSVVESINWTDNGAVPEVIFDINDAEGLSADTGRITSATAIRTTSPAYSGIGFMLISPKLHTSG